MANVLSLALRINADASGVNLTPVERALKRLGTETDKVTKVFDRFTADSEAAARAQDATRKSLEDLIKARQDGTVSAPEFQRRFNEITEAAKSQAAAFEEGAKIQQRYGDQQANTQKQLDRLTELYKAGAIDLIAYNKASSDLLGIDKAAEESARARADAEAEAARATAALESEAARIRQQNATAQERFDAAIERANLLRDQGLLTEQDYRRELERQAGVLAKATVATEQLGDATEQTANETLKFNELSGIFAALPGPIGSLAGRISGLSSAGEGLSRIFSGGLSQGISGLVESFTQLVNPVTAALAGVTAFAAAATKITQGLIQLEDRVERLGNQAFQLGVSFEFVQVLEESARRSGTSVDALRGATTRLQQQLVEARNGSATAAAAIDAIGVSFEQLDSQNPDEQFRSVATAIASIEDPAERTAAATRLFGEAGVQLLPFFRNLPIAGNDIERVGRALTDIDKQQIDALGSSLDAIGVATQGLGQSLLLPFVGLGDGISRALAEATAGVTAIVDPIGRVLEPLLTQIGRIIEFIGTVIGNAGRQVGAVFEPFAAAVQAVNQALTPLSEGLFDFLDSLSDAAVVAAEWIASFNPLNLVTDNVGGLVTSIRDGLAPVLETIGRIVTIITTAVQRFSEAAVRVFGEAVSTAQSAVTTFAEFTGLATVIERFASAVSTAFNLLWNGIRQIVSQIGGFIERVVSFAERWLGIRRDIEQPVDVEINVPTNVGVQLTEELSKAQEKVAEFGNAGTEVFLEYSAQLDEIAELVEEGEYTQEQANRAIALATQEYDRQRQILSDNVKEQERLARVEEDRRKAAAAETEAQIARIDELLGKTQQASQAEQDFAAIETEIARVTAAAAAARDAGNAAEADALASRLAELDQLQAGVAEQIEAAAAGFDSGYEAAFEKVRDSLGKLTDQASQFGEEGIAAAAQLQEGIAAAQEQARDGILNQAAFEAEIARQETLFENRLQQLKDEEAERLRIEKAIADERQRVNEFVDEQLALAAVGGDSQRLAAARNLASIEQEIARVREEADAAAAAGDNAAAEAGLNRIAQLEQIAAKEEEIASGRRAAEAEIARQREQSAKAQEKVFADAAKSQQQQAQQAQQAQQQQAAEAQKALEEQAKRNEELLERSRQLATASTEAAQGADIRTEAGARAFIQAIQGGFDPQLAIARQQLQVQRQIAAGIRENLAALGFQTFQFPAVAGA